MGKFAELPVGIARLDFSNVTSSVGHYGPATAIFPRGRRVRNCGWGRCGLRFADSELLGGLFPVARPSITTARIICRRSGR